MGKEGLEPSRLSAHDPKSCLSANSSTSPWGKIISQREYIVNKYDIIVRVFLQRINNNREAGLSRIITPESAAKERAQYQRAIVVALREILGQSGIGSSAYDLAAFITIMLQAIDASIDQSVSAWEKRGYWIKADRFRQEWQWAGDLGRRMRIALLGDDWDDARAVIALLMNKLSKVKLPTRHGIGMPWIGAWEKLLKG